MKLYDQKHIQDFYNTYGEAETQRWNRSLVEQVKLRVHQHYLHQYIHSGDTILELGAGTGVFTQELVKYTDNLIVTDLSPAQLELNKKRATEQNYTNRVKVWTITDICDLSAYADNSFDKIVCYGGPLSYVFEQKTVALNEMKRVLKPNGILLLGVMNLWGSIKESLNKIVLPFTKEDNEKVIATGNLHPSAFTPSDHHCHMFTSEELKSDIQQAGFKLLALSASSCLSILRFNELAEIIKDKEKWDYFMDLEIRACRSSGMVESGTHMIAVVQK